MNNKKKYDPPTIVNINGCGVSGGISGPPHDRDRGECASGNAPFYACNNGPDFLGACGPGGTPDTSACNPGGAHTFDSCDSGGYALTGCLSGHAQQ